MKSTAKFVTALLAVGILGVLPAQAEGDAAAGKKVFAKCTACHDATTGKDKIGPTLVGVFGRKAGTLESYLSKYSANMKEAGAGGLVWDDANLTAYFARSEGCGSQREDGVSGFEERRRPRQCHRLSEGRSEALTGARAAPRSDRAAVSFLRRRQRARAIVSTRSAAKIANR